MRAILFALLLVACGGGQSVQVPEGPMLTVMGADACAISSVIWDGVEFIDSRDHGRELQSAVQFDGLSEADNPTEAGSRGDPPGSSTSAVQQCAVNAGSIVSTVRMAYWQPWAGQAVSDTLLHKDVALAWTGDAHLMRYAVTFTTPTPHASAQFEALTGYMPLAFSRFYALEGGQLRELPVLPAGQWIEQTAPLVFATDDGAHAMGVRTFDAPMVYGAWRFDTVVKWNLMSRVTMPPETASFVVYVAVGTLEQVRSALMQLG